MAHPYRKEGIAGHNAKLRRMTRHYGAANPSMHKEAPVDTQKKMGPEESIGYGADSAAANARSDRPGRRTKPTNPIASYRKGGAVKSRAMGGGIAKKGRGKKEGKTNINITLMPHSGAQTPPIAPPIGSNPAVPPAAMPPRPPMGGPPGMPPGGAPPNLGALAMQNQVANQLPRKRGGRVHSDAREDRKLIDKMVKPSALKRAHGGRMPSKVGLTGGAQSGEGRMERNKATRGRKGPPVRGVVG